MGSSHFSKGSYPGHCLMKTCRDIMEAGLKYKSKTDQKLKFVIPKCWWETCMLSVPNGA